MGTNDVEKIIEKVFPDYFDRFDLPEGAHEESIKVYRACRSGKCDRDSFIPTFEQNGCKLKQGQEKDDPSVYSLSTFEKPNHIKMWASLNSDMHVPFKIAIGYTDPRHGVVQRTRERKSKSKSHVDWWLYRDAEPYMEFELIDDFEKHLKEYLEGRDRK